MNATSKFCPIASSPRLVEAPSDMTSPFEIISPTATNGLWFIQVF